MMRIKEAIQRRRLIQEMNEEWNAYDEENAEAPSPIGRALPIAPCEEDAESTNSANSELALQQFAQNLNAKMNALQRRALRITWKRLSEAPRTSGRGTINIMEKVFEKMVEKCSDVMPIFYRSAFLSCVEDKRRSRRARPGRTIATIRDHAHLLVDFIEDILCLMFDTPLQHAPLDPHSIARFHSRLEPLGFRRCLWNLFGELFAEVMFSQECVRAYPHAASAWSMLGVALSDSFHAASKRPKTSTVSLQDNNSIAGRASNSLRAEEHRLNSDSSLTSETASCGGALVTMPNVALAACITGSCMSAVASYASRRQSIPLEQLNSTSPPSRVPLQCTRSIRYDSESVRQIADTYQTQSRCAFEDDARVTIV